MTDSLIARTLDDAVHDVLASGDEAAREFLRTSFLAAAVDGLWRARTEAGLTQTEVANILGTKQSAIARLEADTAGTLSLHRYVDYCLAVGKFPFDIELVLAEDLRVYAADRPDAPRTSEEFRAWQQLHKTPPAQAIVHDGQRRRLPSTVGAAADESCQASASEAHTHERRGPEIANAE